MGFDEIEEFRFIDETEQHDDFSDEHNLAFRLFFRLIFQSLIQILLGYEMGLDKRLSQSWLGWNIEYPSGPGTRILPLGYDRIKDPIFDFRFSPTLFRCRDRSGKRQGKYLHAFLAHRLSEIFHIYIFQLLHGSSVSIFLLYLFRLVPHILRNNPMSHKKLRRMQADSFIQDNGQEFFRSDETV